MSEEERKKPSFIVNSVDLKKSLTASIFNMIQVMKDGKIEGVSVGTNTTAAVITNFGLVRGRVILFDDESEKEIYESQDYDSLLYLETIKNVDELMANLESEIGPENIKVINHTGRLILADVTITPYANPQNKFSFSRLLLFSDQIVGITYGEETRR